MAGSYSDGSSSDNDSWDLNFNPMDDEDEISQHVNNVEVRKRAVDLPAMEVIQNTDDNEEFLPKVGMIFQSEDHAYSFYNTYARRMGFSVRKGELKRLKSGRIYLREFVCSRQGSRANHTRGPAKKPRPLTRTKCRACIRFKGKEDGTWVVRRFIEDHNHSFASQSEVHLLRSQRKQDEQHDSIHFDVYAPVPVDSGVGIEQGRSQHLNLKQNDCANCYQKRHGEIYNEGEVQVILNYFRRMQQEDPGFSYAIQVDQDNRICNLFWVDAKSKVDYGFFDDVICLDTTFRTSKDGVPCAPIVGVNQHGMTVLFGCALLLDESTETFVWLFESFVNLMSGKRPKTILTDQSQEIANAIAQVMPRAHHRLCLWHIYQNAAKHLSHVYESNRQFKKDFKKCIYSAETEEVFQSEWNSMLEKYSLSNDKWLTELHEIRGKWALVYGREHFCAGMTTTQRSESVKASFRSYLKGTSCITDFVNQYEKAVVHMRQRETEEDFKNKLNEPVLTSRSSIEKHAAHVYTRNAFKTFQERFRDLACYLEQVEDERGSVCVYKVEMLDGIRDDRTRNVMFNSDDSTVECTCKSFEFTGILCVHALRVLLARRIAEIPPKYILKRWRKDAKGGVAFEDFGIEADYLKSSSLVYGNLARNALTIAMKGAVDEQSSRVVRQHLSACLEELDRIQREAESKSSQDIRRNTCHQTNPTDPTKNKDKGVLGKRTKNSLGRESKMNTAQKAKEGGSELSFISPSHECFFPRQPIAYQGSSGNHNQPIMIHTTEVSRHINQASFGQQGQSVQMHTSEVPIVNQIQGQSGDLGQSVLMHFNQM